MPFSSCNQYHTSTAFCGSKKGMHYKCLVCILSTRTPSPPFNVLLCLASFEYIIPCMRLLHPIWRYSTPMQSICAYYCVIMCICIKLCVLLLLHQMCCTIYFIVLLLTNNIFYVYHEHARIRVHTTHASAFHFNFNALLSPHKHKFVPYTNTYYIFQ